MADSNFDLRVSSLYFTQKFDLRFYGPFCFGQKTKHHKIVNSIRDFLISDIDAGVEALLVKLAAIG